MLHESYLFVSKQAAKYPYLYFEIPFDNANRTLVHAIDHIHAQRLENLSSVGHVHCETFSGTNTYAIEVQFNQNLTSEMLVELNRLLWEKPLDKTEIQMALATTQLEGFRNFYKRKNMYTQLWDHGVQSESELLELYKSINSIPTHHVQKIWEVMNQAPKIVIAHVQKNLTFKHELERLLSSGTITTEDNKDSIVLPDVLVDGVLNESDFVHVELVFKLPLADMLAYQKASLLFHLYQEVLYKELFRVGLVYDFDLLVHEIPGGITHMVFEFDCLNKFTGQIRNTVTKIVGTELEKLNIEDHMVRDVLELAHDEVHAWHENELERDFNHAWQIIVFGEESYRKPETVESFLTETSLSKLQQYRDKLGTLSPNHVVVVKY